MRDFQKAIAGAGFTAEARQLLESLAVGECLWGSSSGELTKSEVGDPAFVIVRRTEEKYERIEGQDWPQRRARVLATRSPSAVRVLRLPPSAPMSDRSLPRAVDLDEYMALLPSAVEKAFFFSLFGDEEKKPYEMNGDVAIVSIDGPLMQRGGWWWDGYDAIRGRFEKALADTKVKALVLKINSPGGVCSGCFSAARRMRAMKEESGKPVFAYADESAYSAAYAMACIADEVYLPKEGGVGSVGVIGVLYDRTASNEKEGYRVAVITSGEYKADGHPDVPLTEAVVKRYQARIDTLARSFAELVGDARGMSAEQVLKLEAACLYGEDAVRGGLANGVATLEQTIERAQKQGIARAAKARNTTGSLGASTGKTNMNGKTNAGQTNASSSEGMATGELLVVSFASFALAVGLAHDATEADILAGIGRVKDDAAKAQASTQKLVDALGVKTSEEGVSKIVSDATVLGELVKAITGDDKATAQDAVKKLAADRKGAEFAEAKGLIDKAQADGKTAGEKAFGIYEKHGLDALKAHLDALVPNAALVNKAPAQPSGEDAKGGASPTPKTDGEVVLSADDKAMCEKYGLDEKAFLETRKREVADKKKAEAHRAS